MAQNQLKLNYTPIFTDRKPYNKIISGTEIIYEPNYEEVINILKDSIQAYEKNKKFAIDIINFYNGEQADSIPSNGRKFDEKIVVNLIKPIIDNLVSIEMNEPFTYSLIPRKDDLYENKEELFKKDIEILVHYLMNEGVHHYDYLTREQSIISGWCFRYVLQQDMENDITIHSPFTIGIFEPYNTFVVHSYDIGNKIIFSAHETEIVSVDNKTYTQYTCFDNKFKYIIRVNGSKYEFIKQEQLDVNGNIVEVDSLAHDLPYNPVQVYQNGQFYTSLPHEMRGEQTSLNISKTCTSNDQLFFVSKLLAIIGCELTEELLKALIDNNILCFPANENGGQQDVKYVSQNMDYNATNIKEQASFENMLYIASCPSNKVGRAETGVAVKLASGHTQANFNANRREQEFIKPKRQELDNVIAILRRTGKITSDITSNDIEIKFDKSRLTTDKETIDTVLSMINANAPIYEVLNKFRIFNDPEYVSRIWQKNIDKAQTENVNNNLIKSETQNITQGETQNAQTV